MPGLDGLRGLAVLAVLGYHLGIGWCPGGLLGVGVFFTLSGYLITDLLLSHWDRSGRLGLGDFWLRRARRLLPALYVMLAVVTAWVALGDPGRLADLRGAVLSAIAYVGNWWLIDQHVSYFARFGPPSPLGHLWSLAIEEQFYLAWPWLLLIGLRLVPERARALAISPRLAGLTLLAAAASAIAMAVIYEPGFDYSRFYYGTDTRAFAILAGAALAMVWPSRLVSGAIANRARLLLDGAGFAGLAGIALLVRLTNPYSAFLYPLGLVLLSLATLLVVAAAAHPATATGRALAVRPLRWIGVRSYAIYLWHFPIIVLTTPSLAEGPGAVRGVLQAGASFLLAALSWRFVEEPARRGEIGRALRRLRERGLGLRWLGRRARVAVAATAALLLLDALALAGARPPGPVHSIFAPTLIQASARSSLFELPATSEEVEALERAGAGPRSRRTACRSVVHIGDSTSLGLTSPDYIPRRRERIEARYAQVGVRHERFEISGATSIVETLPGGVNAYEVARGLRAHGYRGCWVLALGTNDTADVYVGSNVGLDERVERMMSVIGNQPVLWVNVRSLVRSGPYAEANMERWNQTLLEACARYPNMRVYDWAHDVKPAWFIPDGIHYTTDGYIARARLIARALARAFPAVGESPTCVIR